VVTRSGAPIITTWCGHEPLARALISLKPDANNKLSAGRGHKVYYGYLGESVILFAARVGVRHVGVPDTTRKTSDERMDATYVCVGRGFLPGTEIQNSEIEAIKGTAAQRREEGKFGRRMRGLD